MRKKIKSLSDVEFIINNKCDVYDNRGNKCNIVYFLGMSLLDIVKLINSNEWTYDIE